jgi:hypothetical protein
MSLSILRILIISCFFLRCHAFLSSPIIPHDPSTIILKRSRRITQLLNNNNNEDDNNELDDFLDQSYFDPEQFDDEDQGPLAWFANLVKSDYELAETLYVGTFFVILVIITQELLRMQLYGDRYIPFTKLGSGANLF